VNSSTQARALRRTLAPYALYAAIFALGVLLIIAISIKLQQWTPLAFLPLLAFFVSGFAYLNLKYSITWDDKVIRQQAGQRDDVVIPLSEITDVCLETSGMGIAQSSRPSRRIAIYQKSDSALKAIDVSLKHFRREDIATLLSDINKARPDLSLPAV